MNATNIDYHRVAEAIDYLFDNFKKQPTLDEVARQVHVSPLHFQRIFTEWAGVSPKKFLQFLSIEHLRSRIFETSNLSQAADLVGMSAQSRVYDLFVNIESVTPQEFKTFGHGLAIDYGFHETPFGECLLATTPRGICNLSFVDEKTKQTEFDRMLERWQAAEIRHRPEATEPLVGQIFEPRDRSKLHLLVRGTNFQMKVWEALLRIPTGAVATYESIAASIGQPAAVRAVGTAVGQNPVGFLIPCHRVIRKEGNLGEYHWGSTRKKAIVGWEMARTGEANRV